MTSRRLAAVAVLGPAIGIVFLACAPKAPVAPDDGWSPKLAPATAAVDARTEESRPASSHHDLLAELADASVEDLTAAFQQRITPAGVMHWRIDRQAFDLLFLRDGALLAGSCRMVPEQVDGSIVGMRVFGVRPSGIAGQLGLQNGDRLETVNGLPLVRPDQALAIYLALQNTTQVEVGVVRGGKPMTLKYDVVDVSPP